MFRKSENQPSSQEVQEHMKTHIPYRSWCATRSAEAKYGLSGEQSGPRKDSGVSIVGGPVSSDRPAVHGREIWTSAVEKSERPEQNRDLRCQDRQPKIQSSETTIALRNDDIQEFDSKWDGIIVYDENPHDDVLEGLHKLTQDRVGIVCMTHQKKLGPDYHRLKTVVKRSIEQEI